MVASQNCGTWQTWIQFSSLMIKKSWIITEEYPYWVLFLKFCKSVFSHVFSLFFRLSFTIYRIYWNCISVSVHVIFYFEVLLAFMLIFETENRIKLSSQNTGQINHPISFLIKKPITSLFWMLHESLRTSSLGEPLCKRQKMNLIWCGLRWPRTEISRALFPTKHMFVMELYCNCFVRTGFPCH